MSPLPPTRRGACPALTRPMETGDGLLARLVPADGALSPAQLDGLAQAAQSCGNGLLEVTARGSLQVRGLRPETVAPLNAQVAALDIAPREGMAMDVSPLSGRDATETADARPLAAHLKAKLTETGLMDRLGPKVSVVLDGGGAVRLDALSADVRLRALLSPSRVVWEVALAGDATSARPLALLDKAAAVEEAFAWLDRLAALGPSARMADLLAQAAAPPSQEGARDTALCPIGAPRIPAKPAAIARPTPAPIGRFPLRDGTFAVGFGVPFGQIEAPALSAFAQAAAEAGARDLRPAPGRVLLACGLSQAGADALARLARSLSFLTRADDPRAFLSACAGAPACRSAHMPARALAPALADSLAPLLDGSIAVHVSACAKGCAHPAPAALTFVGMDAGVGLVREGTAEAAPDAVLPLAELEAGARALAHKAAPRPGEDGRSALARCVDLLPRWQTSRKGTMLEPPSL